MVVVDRAPAASPCLGPGPGLHLLMPISIFTKVLQGAGAELGFVVDILKVTFCSAKEGVWGTGPAYPCYDTGESWQLKQPLQPRELALCRSTMVQLTTGNSQDLELWACVIPLALCFLAQTAAQMKW